MQATEEHSKTAIRAVIVDDERGGRFVLQKLLEEYCRDVEIIGIADSAEAGKETIEQLQPDLVFLDVEMPYQNGFEMLESIATRNFDVVFVSAHASYATKAEQYSTFGLLLKPYNLGQLRKAIQWFETKKVAKGSMP